MVKQSSIEWLIECMSIHLTEEQKTQFEGLFQQAIAMHQEEIYEAFYHCDENGWVYKSSPSHYYNQVFKGGSK